MLLPCCLAVNCKDALLEDLLEGIDRTLRHAGYQTLIGVTHYYRAEEESLLSEQLLPRPANLIITCLGRSDSIDNLLPRLANSRVHAMQAFGYASCLLW